MNISTCAASKENGRFWIALTSSLDRNMAKKPGLYANIAAKRRRIKLGSDEKMRKPGSKGAPTAQAFRDAAKTAKKPKGSK